MADSENKDIKMAKPVEETKSVPTTASSIGELQTKRLRRVPDRIPWVVLLIIIVELGERFTYFGLSGPLQNYIKLATFNR
jgi:hypothetical protein